MLSMKVGGAETNSVSASVNTELKALVAKTTVSKVFVLFSMKNATNIYWYY